jgi:hypothetical protein
MFSLVQLYLTAILLFVALLTVNATTLVTLNGSYGAIFTTSCGEYSFFKVYMTESCNDLTISANVSTGEPDVFVSRRSMPTKSTLSWAAYKDGDYDVTISHWDPESSPGWYYISIFGDCSSSNASAVYQIKTTLSTSDSDDLYLYPSKGSSLYFVS